MPRVLILSLIIFGSIPAMRRPLHAGSDLTVFQSYIPVLICLSLALLPLISLPIPLVTHRQLGVLRRFATTPAPPSWLLAARQAPVQGPRSGPWSGT